MQRLISELHRRKVLRVAGFYLGLGWGLVQVAGWLKGALNLPMSFDSIVFAALAIGFVPVLIVTWMFEITIDGIKRTPPLADGVSSKPETVDWVLAVVLLALLGMTAIQSVMQSGEIAEGRKSAVDTATTTASQMKAIAVLPFGNTSPPDEAFAVGLTDEIRRRLDRTLSGKVVVRSRRSSDAYKDTKRSVREIASALLVTHILEGSLRREGGLVRIDASLIDATRDAQIKPYSYELKLDRIFAVQDQIATDIAGDLGVEFDYASAPRSAPTRNMRAYRLFLEARGLFLSREKGSLDVAIEKFKRAVSLDSNFAEAHAGLASSYFSKASRMNSGYQKYLALASPSAETARLLKPDLAQAYAVSGSLGRVRLKWEEAFTNGKKSVELPDTDDNARLWYGLTQFYAGYLDQARGTLEEVQKNDPTYTFVSLWLARVAFARGDDDAGAAMAEKLIGSTADYRGFGYWYLAYLAQRRGDANEAEKNYRAAVEVWGTGKSVAGHVIKALHSPEAHAETLAALWAEAARDPEFAPETEFLLIGEEAAFVEALKMRLARNDTDGFSYFLSFLWRAPGVKTESFRELVRSAGLVDYWRKHGWPDKCRPSGGEEFICE
jgi:adenylate cyclase